MNATDNDIPQADQQAVEAIAAVIERHGDAAHCDHASMDIAFEWFGDDFTAEQANEWLAARCFFSGAARQLADVGITPEQARAFACEGLGVGCYTDTIGYKVAKGDLSVELAAAVLRGDR